MASAILSPAGSGSNLFADPAAGGWASFDMSLIHPAHGLSFSQNDLLPPVLTQAEKLMASLECDNDYDSDRDTSMDEGDDSYGSDSSLETPVSSSLPSLAGSEYKASSSFPFPPPQIPMLCIPRPLQRISSCDFSPRPLTDEECITPVDDCLERQLSATCSSESLTPKASCCATFDSVDPFSRDMKAVASSSSTMLRSFSAPVRTLMEFQGLQQRWNAEATAARISAKGKERDHRDSLKSTYPISQAVFGDGVVPARRSHDDLTLASEQAYDADGNGESISDNYSSREKYLSPNKKHNRFKRSRFADEGHNHPIRPAFRQVSSATNLPTIHEPVSPTHNQCESPTKVSKRPGFNRHFTMPTFSFE